jgi:FkbM family methyltransferase
MKSQERLFRNHRRIIHTGNLLISANHIVGERVRILHVGAHEAQEQDLYSEYGLRDVYWVEPLPHLIVELKKKFPEENVIPFAVWSKKTEMKLQIANNEVSSSFYKFAPTNPFINQETISEVQVQTITLDEIIEKLLPLDDIPIILVLDIQGSEFEALSGLSKKNSRKILGIVVEVSEIPIYAGAAPAEELRKRLNTLGYKKILSLVRPPTNHGDELFLKDSVLFSIAVLIRALVIRLIIKISLVRFIRKEKKNLNVTTLN